MDGAGAPRPSMRAMPPIEHGRSFGRTRTERRRMHGSASLASSMSASFLTSVAVAFRPSARGAPRLLAAAPPGPLIALHAPRAPQTTARPRAMHAPTISAAVILAFFNAFSNAFAVGMKRDRACVSMTSVAARTDGSRPTCAPFFSP